MKIDIDNLTEEELRKLNRRIVERLKIIESLHNHKDMMQFDIGEKVSFQPPGRELIIATLIKYNKKTVSVLTEEGDKWNVSPHLLEKYQDLGSVDGDNNVFEIGAKKKGS